MKGRTMLDKDLIKLTDICLNNAYKVYGDILSDDVLKRLNWELDAIKKLEISTYFLQAIDIMNYLNVSNYEIGTRGAISGSLVAYLCGITSLDPIVHNLSEYFTFGYYQDRFLDIDVNVTRDMLDNIAEFVSVKAVDDKVTIGNLVFRYNSTIELIHETYDECGMIPGKINLNNPKVIKFLDSTESSESGGQAYNMYMEKLKGLPECSTEIAKEILIACPVKSFEDMVKVACLAHGIGTWRGNASCLLDEKQVSIRDIISNRDDVFDYLVDKSIDEKIAFEIARRVSKGKGLSQEHIKVMEKYNVPLWYIESCLKIRYLHCRAHATSYVLYLWYILTARLDQENTKGTVV